MDVPLPLHSNRPDHENGTFQMTGLPPNESYRAIAVDYLEDGEEMDPDFLKRMREPRRRGSRCAKADSARSTCG